MMKPFVKIINHELSTDSNEYIFIVNGVVYKQSDIYRLGIFNRNDFGIFDSDKAKQVALMLIGYNINVYDVSTNSYKLLNNLGLQYPLCDAYIGVYYEGKGCYYKCWFVDCEIVYLVEGHDPLDTLLNHICEEYSFVINECYDEDLKDDIEYL